MELRNSDKGEILESFILNPDGTPYDLTGKSVVFNENKDGDRFVSDSNVTIVDANSGHIAYQVHDQVHSASGTAWFDIVDSSGAKIDSTSDFYIEVRDGLDCTIYNTTYVSDFEKLKQKMDVLIAQADSELKIDNAKIDQLKASVSQVDWTTFVKSVNGDGPDANGAVTLPTYSYPTDTALNTAVNLNSDPYLDTGIYKINNCPVTNGPWADTNAPHWFYLNVAKYDDYNIVQTMNLGYTLYSRIVSKAGNSYPSWVQYASMDQLYSAVNLRVQSVNGHTPDANGAVTLPTLTAKTLTDYDFENGNCTFDDSAHFDANGNFSRWMLDPNVVFKLVNAHKDVRNHTDYRYPTDITSNTAVNLNSDPYLDTGIYRIENCAIINSPWPVDPNQRFWIYLKVIKYDDNTIYQSLFFGNSMYGRSVSKVSNSFPSWTQYATTDQVTDVSDRLSAVANNLGMFQHRVDYATPSGTISNQTVDFNNYLETGILRVQNCTIKNGPYAVNDRYPNHSVFLKVVAFDSQTQYQTVYEGDNLYGRKVFNGSGQWHKYTNTPM